MVTVKISLRGILCLAMMSIGLAQDMDMGDMEMTPPVDVNMTPEQQRNANRTISIGFILFPGFDTLDVYGPLEIIGSMSYYYPITLSTISFERGPVNSRPPPHKMGPDMPASDFSFMIGTSTIATHTFDDAPALDIIFVSGGMGNVALEQSGTTAIEDFIARRFEAADYVLSVCTGTLSLARSKILNGRKATTNKSAWAYVTSFGENVTWVPSARWVEDGKVWTSSGVASGLDMTYAFLKHLYGEVALNSVMNVIEYAPHSDPHWDPFSVVNKVPGADTSRSLEDCVKPAGT